MRIALQFAWRCFACRVQNESLRRYFFIYGLGCRRRYTRLPRPAYFQFSCRRWFGGGFRLFSSPMRAFRRFVDPGGHGNADRSGRAVTVFCAWCHGAADVKVFAALGAWCGMHALIGLWMAASLAAGMHAIWLLITTRTRLAGLLRHHGATFELAGKTSTPYAACLTVAASAWLVLQGLAGGLR
jgi:hypothetical protein